MRECTQYTTPIELLKMRILFMRLKLRYYKAFKGLKLKIDTKIDDDIGVEIFSGTIEFYTKQIDYIAKVHPVIIKRDLEIAKIMNCSLIEVSLLHEMGHWLHWIADNEDFWIKNTIQDAEEETWYEGDDDWDESDFDDMELRYRGFALEKVANEYMLLLAKRDIKHLIDKII